MRTTDSPALKFLGVVAIPLFRERPPAPTSNGLGGGPAPALLVAVLLALMRISPSVISISVTTYTLFGILRIRGKWRVVFLTRPSGFSVFSEIRRRWRNSATGLVRRVWLVHPADAASAKSSGSTSEQYDFCYVRPRGRNQGVVRDAPQFHRSGRGR